MFAAKKVAALSVLPAALIIGSGAVSALPAPAPASASVRIAVPAAGATQCEGDLCIKNLNGGGVPGDIKAWARRTGFTGHFELRYHDGHIRNSPTRYWRAHGSGYHFNHVPIGNGYQMIAWKGKHHFTNIGQVGFGVG